MRRSVISRRLLSTASEIDFFGISHVTSKEVAGTSRSSNKLQPDQLSQKYHPLELPRRHLINKENDIDMTFGKIRFDNDNVPKVHGQYEPTNEELQYDEKDIKQIYSNQISIDEVEEVDEVGSPSYKISRVNASINIADIFKLFKQPSVESINKYANQPPLKFFFESTMDPIEVTQDSKPIAKTLPGKLTSRRLLDETELEQVIIEAHLDSEKPSIRTQKAEPCAEKLKERFQDDELFTSGSKIRLDSKGFHDYRGQVPDWKNCRRVDALDFIRNSIIYDNYDILAVNKPYGLAVHENERQGDDFDVNNLVQEIAKDRRVERVYLAHRLDKTTTGVLLFATSQRRADTLNKLFETVQIKKVYWCVTVGVPELHHAIIDIPIGEFKVADRERRCLVPDSLESKKQLTKKHRHARKAITEYKVLSHHRGAALLEVKPTTGVKHQIRCHLSFGLNCPILGDHKYSHLERIAPQTLPQSMLTALHLRQTKARTLPMHLHAKSIVIPGAKANGESLFLHAPVPEYFDRNMRALNLGKQVRK